MNVAVCGVISGVRVQGRGWWGSGSGSGPRRDAVEEGLVQGQQLLPLPGVTPALSPSPFPGAREVSQKHRTSRSDRNVLALEPP